MEADRSYITNGDANGLEEPLVQQRLATTTWMQSLREAIRVDLSADPSKLELALMSPNTVIGTLPVKADRWRPQLATPLGVGTLGEDSWCLEFSVDAPPKPMQWKEFPETRGAPTRFRSSRSMGFGNAHTEDDVLATFDGIQDGRGKNDIGPRALLVLKLALALLVYGHNTVDTEVILRDVCRGLGLVGANLELSMRSVRCSVGGRTAELLVGKRGVVFDKLVATTRLATHVATVPGVDIQAASATLDSIVDRPLPYGWLIQVFCFVGFASMASLTVFAGAYSDAHALLLIAPFVALIAKACQYNSLLGKLEGALIPMFVGLVTPLVWIYAFPGEACRVTVWILASVLFFLPGVQLIYGAYETEFGSVINGTSRLVAALMRCQFLVMGLTCGWQIFGHNAALKFTGKSGAIASLPPSVACPGDVPWWMGTFVFNLPLLLFLSVLFNLRVRDLFGPMLCGYLSLLAYGVLQHSREFGGPELPGLITNFLGVFIAGNLGSLHEYLTGTPACLSVLPVVLVYAPGSGAVKSMLVGLHASVGDVDMQALVHSNVWGDLVLQGVSYAFGMYLAVVIWRPLNRWRHKARGRLSVLDEELQSVLLQPPLFRTFTGQMS